MRVAIATLGRFHVLDLARELNCLGHDVKFYSYVPQRRAVTFGLPKRCHVSLLTILFPFVFFTYLKSSGRVGNWLNYVLHKAANFAVIYRLQPCDVFICMSGIYLEAAEFARRRYGAKIIIERGSFHIQEQQAILEKINKVNRKSERVSRWDVKRELRGYSLADIVIVPSMHARKTFIDRGFDDKKVLINNYGTDLSLFFPSNEVVRDQRRLLFVGRWSLQKGADLIENALDILFGVDLELIHIGPQGDGPKIRDKRFKSIGAVDQTQLVHWYQSASAIILPSRQEGFGLVLLQALASGCRIIASNLTGAVDMRVSANTTDLIDIIDIDSRDPSFALAESIRRHIAMPPVATLSYLELRELYSWERYGERYHRILEECISRS